MTTLPTTAGDSATRLHTGPATTVRAISVGDTTDLTNGPCRAISCSEAGTISFRDHTGELITGFPVKIGDNPIGVKRITAVSGSMSVWALY